METGSSNGAKSPDYDAVIVGGSLAGCTTAILLGREGLRVAVVEKQPDPDAFKRICSHFIQASGVPTIERLDLLDPIIAAGGVRSRIQAWTEWGWLEAAARGGEPRRSTCAARSSTRWCARRRRRPRASTSTSGTPRTSSCATARRSPASSPATATAAETTLRAKLVIGADGRDSHVAEMAEVDEKVLPHARFAYGGYFEGELPDYAPDSAIWFLDPHWAAAFPTDSNLMFYAAMPTKELLPEFKRDPTETLVSFVADLPDAPPIRDGAPGRTGDGQDRHAEPDAASRSPPAWPWSATRRWRRTRCSGSAAAGRSSRANGSPTRWRPALHGEESLERGLKRYRRLHKRKLGGHAFMIHDYSTGRKLTPARTDAVLGRRPRPEDRRDLRQVRDPPGRAGEDAGEDDPALDLGQRPARDAPAGRRGIRARSAGERAGA